MTEASASVVLLPAMVLSFRLGIFVSTQYIVLFALAYTVNIMIPCTLKSFNSFLFSEYVLRENHHLCLKCFGAIFSVDLVFCGVFPVYFKTRICGSSCVSDV